MSEKNTTENSEIDTKIVELEQQKSGIITESPKPPKPPEIPFADNKETQREISGIIWGIFILTFCTQVLTALMYLLTNPLATWQAALVMIIMAAQGTLFGGAIKMLTKKLEWIQNNLDKEKSDGVKMGLQKTSLEDRVKMLEKEDARLNKNLDNAHAEIIALKKELYRNA